jgi:hypothetical protein
MLYSGRLTSQEKATLRNRINAQKSRLKKKDNEG